MKRVFHTVTFEYQALDERECLIGYIRRHERNNGKSRWYYSDLLKRDWFGPLHSEEDCFHHLTLFIANDN